MAVYHPSGAHTSVSLSGVTTLTNDSDEGARGVLVQALAQNIRYTLSNTTPTSSLGFQLKAGDAPARIELDPGMSVRFIQETSGAVLQYQWYK